MVVVSIRGEYPPQVTFVEDDDMVKTVAAKFCAISGRRLTSTAGYGERMTADVQAKQERSQNVTGRFKVRFNSNWTNSPRPGSATSLREILSGPPLDVSAV